MTPLDPLVYLEQLRYLTVEEYEKAVKDLKSKDLPSSIAAAFKLQFVTSVWVLQPAESASLFLSPSEEKAVSELTNHHQNIQAQAREKLTQFGALNDDDASQELRNLIMAVCRKMLEHHMSHQILGVSILLQSDMQMDADSFVSASRIWEDFPQEEKDKFLDSLPDKLETKHKLHAASELLRSAKDEFQIQKIVDWLRPLFLDFEKLEAELHTIIDEGKATERVLQILAEGTAAELIRQIFRTNEIYPSILPEAGFGLGLAAQQMQTSAESTKTASLT